MESVNNFISKERRNKKSVLFWIPYILLIILCFIIFALYKVSILGWLISIIFFIIMFVFRNKILLYSISIQIVVLFVLLIGLSTVFTVTKDRTSKEDNNVSKVPLREISFNKSYNLPQSKGTYELKLSTNRNENKYELGLNIYALTSIIPSNFIYEDSKAKSYIRDGITIYELDQIEAFITSSTTNNDYYSHGPISIKTNYAEGALQIVEMFPTRFTFSFNSEEKLNTFIKKYDQLEVYRYNIGEVGINDFKAEHKADGSYYGSYGYNAEKAYKLHPILLKTTIDWNDMKTVFDISI